MSELGVFLTTQTQHEGLFCIFLFSTILRPSFLDAFYASLGWSQDEAPELQAPAGNRPLSGLLLPVFLWAACSRVICRRQELLDGAKVCVLPHPRKQPRSRPRSTHTDLTPTGSPAHHSQCSPLIMDKTFFPETMIFDLQRKCTESYLILWEGWG